MEVHHHYIADEISGFSYVPFFMQDSKHELLISITADFLYFRNHLTRTCSNFFFTLLLTAYIEEDGKSN